MDQLEKQHEQRDVDVSGAARGVWLVKVPKYLSERWEQCDGEVGKLRINKPKKKGDRAEVLFTLNQQLAAQNTGTGPCPRDHKFVLNKMDGQSLSVICREPNITPTGEEIYPEKVSIQGKVVQRAECRPIVDNNYINLKKVKMESVNKPQKQTVVLDKVVQNYKPVAQHDNEVEYARQKKEEGKKSRLDKEIVMDLLFKAFEKHQYYNVKDLVKITQQPITHLKDILKEICSYNMKAPHRNMWELKPEYRHYKSGDS